MKYLIVIVFALFILTKQTPQLKFCNIDTAIMAFAPRYFFDTTIDGRAQNVFVTRFYHNKIGFNASELGRCYFNIIEPYYLFQTLGIIGLILWLYAIFQLANKKLWLPLFLLMLIPLIPFIQFAYWRAVPYSHKLISILGLLFFLKRNES